jgi:hypothetical protein
MAVVRGNRQKIAGLMVIANPAATECVPLQSILERAGIVSVVKTNEGWSMVAGMPSFRAR